MARRIIWSPESLEDLEQIAQFIERDSAFYAASVVRQIFRAAEPLEHHPRLGRVVPETSDANVRELFVFQYRLIYEIKEQEIHILTVIHGKRILDPKDSLNK